MFSQAELIYSIACTVYVTTCLMFAAVRWFHVCPDTKAHKDYYYPARRVVTLFYLTGIVLVPYILAPQSREAWLLAKGFLPLANFYFCAVLLFTYFGKMKGWRRWRLSGRVATALTFVSIAVLLGIALWPGYHLTEATEQTFTTMVIAVGLLMTLYCVLAIWQVVQWIREFNTDNYSNPDDFPKGFAQRVLFVPVIEAVLIWPMIILDSPAYVTTAFLLLAVFNVAFLISILSPKREDDPLSRMLEHAEPEVKPARHAQMSDQAYEKIAARIKATVEEQQQYLNPHLSLDDVIAACGYSQKYVSDFLREEYGGFFNYVNQLRYRHVDEYMRQHPEVTKEEAILRSGFSSPQSYYRIRKRLFL